MTRAKYRLYIPVAISTKPTSVDFGCAAPMDIFLARLGQEACDYSSLYKRIENLTFSSLKNFLQNYPEEKITYSHLNEMTFSLSTPKLQHPVSLTPPEKVHVKGEKYFIQSFTSLSKQKKISLDISQEIGNPKTQSPKDFNEIHKNFHTLPSGNLTGKLLHKILEIIPFSIFKEIQSPDGLKDWIQPLIQNTSFYPWENVLCQMTYAALKTPLKNGFCLGDVPAYKIYRETEFLYPFEKETFTEDLSWHKGFLKGVIDLIFYDQDQYYLLDWKTNWLGPKTEFYNKENMISAMHQHDYYFQAYIYKEALKRYLKLVDTRPFEEIYGGCFYIFMRGLDETLENAYGILRV